ncbi:MAG: helix-turn-helix transcriptional regulator [Opitutus sp.]
MPRAHTPTVSSLERLVRLLPSPIHPLHGQHAPTLVLPDNLVCFCRRSAADLNRPQRGRALHHRHVLILAVETPVTVCVDDRAIRLKSGEGLLVLPFQFHDYIQPAQEKLTWLFVTFELADGRAFEPLRFRPFVISPVVRQLAEELVRSYLAMNEPDLTTLLLALLLARIKKADPIRRRQHTPPDSPGLIMHVNQLAQAKGEMPGVKQVAQSLNISASHLRARFRASCGVSLGRHLRRLRLEKACGLLRLSPNRVTEIAEQCGFNSIFSFSRAFRSTYGVSPLAYRRGDRPKPNAK